MTQKGKVYDWNTLPDDQTPAQTFRWHEMGVEWCEGRWVPFGFPSSASNHARDKFFALLNMQRTGDEPV